MGPSWAGWGNDRALALWVLYGFGRWRAGRSGGGMDPRRKGWVRVGEGGGETSSSSISSSSGGGGTSGERTPPTKTPKTNPPPRPPRRSPATSRVARKSHPP